MAKMTMQLTVTELRTQSQEHKSQGQG